MVMADFSEANRLRIDNIEKCFGGAGVKLLIPGRVLVGEGILTKRCRKAPKQRQFFLFNDIIVYGSIMINKIKYNKQRLIPLEGVTLEDIEDTDVPSDLANGWLIKTPNKSFAVHAATHTEKQEWMLHINRSITDLLKMTGKVASVSHAAVWVPDEASKVCMHCRIVTFSFYNRRHHCRNCGLIICATCSKNKFLIPAQSSKPVRVCNSCFITLGKYRTLQLTVSSVSSTSSTHSSEHNVHTEIGHNAVVTPTGGSKGSDPNSITSSIEGQEVTSPVIKVDMIGSGAGGSSDSDSDDEDDGPKDGSGDQYIPEADLDRKPTFYEEAQPQLEMITQQLKETSLPAVPAHGDGDVHDAVNGNEASKQVTSPPKVGDPNGNPAIITTDSTKEDEVTTPAPVVAIGVTQQ